MKQQVYNLEEFAAKYHLKNIFGAYAAHFSVNERESGSIPIVPETDGEEDVCFVKMMRARTLFTKLLLVKRGTAKLQISNQINTMSKDGVFDVDGGDENTKMLSPHDFLAMTAKQVVFPLQVSSDFEAECILVDAKFTSEDTLFHLSEDKYKSVCDIFHFVRDIVSHQHINKVEMIESMFNVLRLLLEELPYEQCSITHDLGHKKEIYEIFLHHLYRNFRKERQIRFYADKLNVSTAYLSRLVKEISGSTVNEHVTSLVYKEICNLLKKSDMTMGEIADHLSFSDQSALTNFFKQRAGMSPLAYRNKQNNIN